MSTLGLRLNRAAKSARIATFLPAVHLHGAVHVSIGPRNPRGLRPDAGRLRLLDLRLSQ